MERVDLRLIEYFVAVAEELHFGRAAERLHIAQPSLSHQIRRLEAQLAVTLLERDSRNVRLTPAGAALLQEGRALLLQARQAVRAVRGAVSERVTLAFYGSAATALLPRALGLFSVRRPTIEVAIRELMLGDVDEVLDGTVDVALTRLRPGQADVAIEVLSEEPRVVALAAGHRLAARDRVRFGDLSEERFIVNPAVPGDGAPQRWLREQRRHGLPGRVAAESASLQEILTLVAAARGVCLVPATVAHTHQRPDVAYVPVADAEPAVVSLARRHGQPSTSVAALIDTVREVARRAAG
jgi:DNA-binding transcriptional LysR family regulator